MQGWTAPRPKRTIVFRIDDDQRALLDELVERAIANGPSYPRVTASSLVRQAIKLGLLELEKTLPKKRNTTAIAKRNTGARSKR